MGICRKIFIWTLIFAWIYQSIPVFPVRAEEAAPQARPYVAVMDFEAESGLPAGINRIISDKIRESLLSTAKYILIDRANVDVIMKELAFAQTGVCDQTCAVEIGRALSAHFIVTGRVSQLGPNQCQVSGQMTDVARTDIVRSASERCDCEAMEILNAAEYVALSLAGVEAKPGTVVIQAIPTVAIVYVDGEKKGNTPINVKVKPGSHKIMVAARGFQMSEKILSITPGATVSVSFALKKEKRKWYESWWFLGAVGLAAAGGVAAAVSGSTSGGGGGGGGKSTPSGTVNVVAPVY